MPVKFAYGYGELSSWLKVKVHIGPGLCIIECTYDVICNVYFRSSQPYDYNNNMNTGSYFPQLLQLLFISFVHINYFIIV